MAFGTGTVWKVMKIEDGPPKVDFGKSDPTPIVYLDQVPATDG